MNKIKILLLSSILGIIGIIFYFYFFPKVYPTAALDYQVSKDSVKTITTRLAESLNIDIKKENINLTLEEDNELIKFVQVRFGLEDGNDLLKKLPSFYWNAKIENDSVKTKFKISTNGKLLSFLAQNDFNIDVRSYTLKNLVNNSFRFLKNYHYYEDIYLDSIYYNNQVLTSNANYDSIKVTIEDVVLFKYKSYEDKLKNISVGIDLNYRFNKIVSIETKNNFTKIDSIKEKITPIFSIFNAFIFLFIFILIIFLSYKKIRDYEINYKTGLFLGIILTLFTIISDLNIQTTINSILVGLGIIIVWATTETTVREETPEKFFQFDLIFKNYFNNSSIGSSILTGMSFGVYMSAINMLFIYIASIFFDTFFINSYSSENIVLMDGRLFTSVSKLIVSSSYVSVIFLMLFPTLLNKKLKNQVFTIFLSGIIFLIIDINFNSLLPIDLITSFLIGTILVWIFFKYDFLTTFFAYFFLKLTPEVVSFHFLNNQEYLISSTMVVVFLVLLIVYAIYTVLTKDKITNWKDVSPILVKHISERKRLKGEFDTAHFVQMSFLPKKSPDCPNLDIAAVCYPAKEIGGDYYDFIEYDNNNLGFLIGDVSGKGARAAFFMTLIKGFVVSLKEYIFSPKDLLIKINDHFYKNTTRGNFVTLLIGKIDLVNKKLITARAGHNYCLIKKANGELIEVISKGLAVGIGSNHSFENSLEENKVDIQSGDTIIAYTDGIIEAMNKFRIEYGYNTFVNNIKFTDFENSNDLIEKIIKNVKEHTGNIDQHDDMTLISIRIL